MQDRCDKIFTWLLRIVFVIGLCLGIYQFIYILLASVTAQPIFAEYPRIDLLAIILNFIALNIACLASLFFPAGKYWKYVSVAIGVCGMILCYFMGMDFYTGDRYSGTHSGILWTTVYPLLLWNLWGMFIPYLEKRLRRLWLWGYPTACMLIYLIYLIPPPNY